MRTKHNQRLPTKIFDPFLPLLRAFLPLRTVTNRFITPSPFSTFFPETDLF